MVNYFSANFQMQNIQEFIYQTFYRLGFAKCFFENTKTKNVNKEKGKQRLVRRNIYYQLCSARASLNQNQFCPKTYPNISSLYTSD